MPLPLAAKREGVAWRKGLVEVRPGDQGSSINSGKPCGRYMPLCGVKRAPPRPPSPRIHSPSLHPGKKQTHPS